MLTIKKPIEKYQFNNRTADEQRKIAQMGGKASGIARRKKANLRKRMELLLELEVKDEINRKKLEAMGMTCDNHSLFAVSIFTQALKGNQRAVENIIKILQIDEEEVV